MREFLELASNNNIHQALCTRNHLKPTQELLNSRISDHKFELIITRAFLPAKPSPAPLRHIAECWKIPVEEIVMLGDGVHDMQAGRAAGCVTIALGTESLRDHAMVDYWTRNYADLGCIFQDLSKSER